MRKSYLRDVVFLKQIMMEMFNDEERKVVMEQYQSMLPSLDMKQVIPLSLIHSYVPSNLGHAVVKTNDLPTTHQYTLSSRP